VGGFNPAPGDGSGNGGAPDIHVPDFTSAARQTVAGQKAAGFFDDLWVSFHASFLTGINKIIGLVIGGMDDILAIATRLMTAGQGISQPGFFSMVAAIIGDLLGTEVSADAIRSSYAAHGRTAALRTAGGDVWNALVKEFSPAGGTVTPASGVQSAQAFLGFLVEFAVRQGNVAFFSELLPMEFNIVGGLREYGELLAKNLGLGRLARRALQPLVQVLIADPLTWSLNEQYRPTMLSPTSAIKAYFRGALPDAELRQQLARHGYSEAAIQQLILDASRLFTTSELYELVKWGTQDAGGIIPLLVQQGMTEEQAKLVWEATKFQNLDPIVGDYMTLIRSRFRDGFIDFPTMQQLLSDLPLTADETKWFQKLLTQEIIPPWKRPSESQMEAAYLDGFIDLSDIERYWAQSGYGRDDIDLLGYLLLKRQDTAEAKAAAAAKKAKKKPTA
jgi:hypothetical protein